MSVALESVTLGGLLSLDPTIAQNYTPYQPGRIFPPAKRAGHVEIVQGPTLEFARDDLAVIRWTDNNPGGSDDHFAVIHYGTDPTKLSQTAKSHILLNRGHPQTIFRVRVDGLKPQTVRCGQPYVWGRARSGIDSTMFETTLITRSRTGQSKARSY
jgi:hypothetical protein